MGLYRGYIRMIWGYIHPYFVVQCCSHQHLLGPTLHARSSRCFGFSPRFELLASETWGLVHIGGLGEKHGTAVKD